MSGYTVHPSDRNLKLCLGVCVPEYRGHIQTLTCVLYRFLQFVIAAYIQYISACIHTNTAYSSQNYSPQYNLCWHWSKVSKIENPDSGIISFTVNKGAIREITPTCPTKMKKADINDWLSEMRFKCFHQNLFCCCCFVTEARRLFSLVWKIWWRKIRFVPSKSQQFLSMFIFTLRSNQVVPFVLISTNYINFIFHTCICVLHMCVICSVFWLCLIRSICLV